MKTWIAVTAALLLAGPAAAANSSVGLFVSGFGAGTGMALASSHIGRWDLGASSAYVNRPLYQTLSPSGSDDTAAINAAFAACPGGEALGLTSGVFYISGAGLSLTTPGCTLRGAGAGIDPSTCPPAQMRTVNGYSFCLDLAATQLVRGVVVSAPGYGKKVTQDNNAGPVITLNPPTGAGSGDFVVAFVSIQDANNVGTVAPPSGWTPITNQKSPGSPPGTFVNLYAFRATAPVASYAFTASVGPADSGVFIIEGVTRSYPNVSSVNSFKSSNFDGSANGALNLSGETYVSGERFVFCADVITGAISSVSPILSNVQSDTTEGGDLLYTGDSSPSSAPSVTWNAAWGAAIGLTLKPAGVQAAAPSSGPIITASGSSIGLEDLLAWGGFIGGKIGDISFDECTDCWQLNVRSALATFNQ